MPYAEFHRWILAAVLAMARIGAAFSICPAMTDSMIPGVARRVATFAFALLAVPFVKAGMPPGEPNVWMFSFLAMKEALIGFLVGFFAAVPFWIAENVGNLIDNQRGATMGEVYSPLNGAQVSTTGIFFTQIVSTVFFVGGAVFIFLGALYKSFAVWPVFGAWPSWAPGASANMLGALDAMLRTTAVIAAPVIIVMFLATVGLGLVNRTAPQLNVFFLSMPVKSALGVAMLIVYLPFIMDMLMYTKESSVLGPVLKLLGAGTQGAGV
jgi:type III secretion protein T